MVRRSIIRTRGLVAALLLLVLGGGMSVPAAASPQTASSQSVQSAQSAAVSQEAPGSSVLEDSYVRVEGRRGLNLLYNMKFVQAQAIFRTIGRRYPNHPIGPFLGALTTWWKILIDLEDPSHDDAFYAAMDEVIERSNRMLDENSDSQDAAFFKGAALGFRGRLRSNRGKWFRSAYDAKRAMDYVLGLAEKNPANHDFIFGKGIYDYYAALIPERYALARPLMALFPDGDKKRGLRELRRTAEKGWFIQTEAVYFLLQINYRYEESFRKSKKYVQWLRNQHPSNPFFHNFEGRVFAKWGRWRQAQAIFEEVVKRHDAGRTGYNTHMAEQALYYVGRSHMVYDEYRTALTKLVRLERLLEKHGRGGAYRVLGRLRQGMVYDALGQREIAVRRYRSVLEMEDHAEAHERARQFLDEPYGG